jgi:hypothetical protein
VKKKQTALPTTAKSDVEQAADAFLSWERATWSTVDLKLAYVDMTHGDYQAAVLLAQIVYWTVIPGRRGESKLRVQRNGSPWLVKSSADIEAETRLSRNQGNRALKHLKDLGYIVVEVHKWGKLQVPTRHIALNKVPFFKAWTKAVEAEEQAQKARKQAEEQEGPVA